MASAEGPSDPAPSGEGEARSEADIEPDQRTEKLLEALSPVVSLLEEWKERGILAFNWTNWDRIAVRHAQRTGRAAAAFQARSTYKAQTWDEAFHLRLHQLPVGPERRTYRMIGRAVSAMPGEGPRADATEAARHFLRSRGTQHTIESQTDWTPVAIEGSPINREHRDIVRWFEGASEYIVLSEDVASHPLVERLHRLLR